MKSVRYVLFLLFLFLPVVAFSMEDTPANRAKQAERYLQTMPPADLFKDLADQVSLNLDPSQRPAFQQALTKNLDVESIARSTKAAMVRHFTADELGALADFYASPLGKSAMRKFGAYMADIMPVIQAEMAKAVAKTNRSLPASGTGTK